MFPFFTYPPATLLMMVNDLEVSSARFNVQIRCSWYMPYNLPKYIYICFLEHKLLKKDTVRKVV